MQPNSAEYFVCLDVEDYKLCHEMLRANGIKGKYNFTYPTVMAVRDDRVVGFVARHKNDDMVIIGTLALADDLSVLGKSIIAMRLVECLEIILKRHGLGHYWIAADSSNKKLQHGIEKLFQVKPSINTDSDIFYKRSLAA